MQLLMPIRAGDVNGNMGRLRVTPISGSRSPLSSSQTAQLPSSRGRLADVALRIDLVELDGDALGDALFLHGDAVEDVGDLHGALVVGDDDELRGVEEFLDDEAEALVVGLVQRRVHL